MFVAVQLWLCVCVCVSPDRTHWNPCMNPHRELIVSCTLRGGARRLSRGVEGVTGCSGEGLHPLCHAFVLFLTAQFRNPCMNLWCNTKFFHAL